MFARSTKSGSSKGSQTTRSSRSRLQSSASSSSRAMSRTQPLAWWRCVDDIVEADWPRRSAEFDEMEVPGRLWHWAPLFALGADVKGAASLAGERGVIAARPAGDACAGEMGDPRVDEGAYAVRDREAINEDHAAPLSQR